MTNPSESSATPAPPAGVRIETVHWDGSGRVALVGEIDMSNVADAEAVLSDLASRGTPLTIDMVALSYLDSQGVSLLFRLAERVDRDGGTLTLANPRGIVRRVLDIMNVADAVSITDDV